MGKKQAQWSTIVVGCEDQDYPVGAAEYFDATGDHDPINAIADLAPDIIALLEVQ